MQDRDLIGRWKSSYTYHDENDTSSHLLDFELSNQKLTGRSQSPPGESAVSLELEYDPATRALTGTWHEITAASGKYGGKIFHGALQLILADDGKSAAGKWVGFNTDASKVNVGNWILHRV
jgi:hypothetical protein